MRGAGVGGGRMDEAGRRGRGRELDGGPLFVNKLMNGSVSVHHPRLGQCKAVHTGLDRLNALPVFRIVVSV